jgi:hypothetical protein
VPLVFVHGVGVRTSTTKVDKYALFRERLSRRYLLPGLFADPSNAPILNPYWGGKGVGFAWNHLALPTGGVETLSASDTLVTLLLANSTLGAEIERTNSLPPKQDILRSVARASPEDAIDLLWAVSLDVAAPRQATGLADLALGALEALQSGEANLWASRTTNDESFVDEVWRAVRTPSNRETLGIVDKDSLREGLHRIRQSMASLTGRRFVDALRLETHKRFARFFGDVLIYIQQRGADYPNLGPIGNTVGESLIEAHEQNQNGDPLIVLGHSMGGNIVYDLLSHFLPTLQVDQFVTVGSQVGLFEEMKLFAASDPEIPNAASPTVRRPPNIKRWINIFDYNDVLSFRIERIFDSVKDYSYSTGSSIRKAHSDYLALPSFYRRLRKRLQEQ